MVITWWQMEFNEIYNTFKSKVYRICLGYFNQADKAKDITQEVFITVYENLSKFEHRSSVGTWIYRIATNKCLREIQNEKKRNSVPHRDNIASEEDKTEIEVNLKRLESYIGELQEIDRIIISLFLEGISQQEIARITGMSHANIRVKILRIKAQLLKKFQGDENI